MRQAAMKGFLATLMAISVIGAVGCSSDNDDDDRYQGRSRPARASENFRDKDHDGHRDGLEDRDRDGIRDGDENGGVNRHDPDRYR